MSCHVDPSGAFDIVGLRALGDLPEGWAILSEDAFDLDGDGIAGVLRYVGAGPGGGGPRPGLFGRKLAAGGLADFALIAGAAHGVELGGRGVLDAVVAAFVARSPDPAPAPASALAIFEARGCALCHVTREFDSGGRSYRPLSDFLLHDLGDGPVRTAPLWGCDNCLTGPGHPVLPDRLSLTRPSPPQDG